MMRRFRHVPFGAVPFLHRVAAMLGARISQGLGLGRACTVGLVLLALAGCKTDLLTNLSEAEANQIVALLLESGISASKVYTGDALVTVRIEERDMLAAVSLLKHGGFPKMSRDSLGSVFQKTGIMSSPFEERVRFIYALSQELSTTLDEIDGVHTARVHIVLPDSPELGADVVPSSAAVFIKHRAGVDLDFLTPQIKRLVSNSIEGMSYDKVSVVLIEAERGDTVHHAEASEEITFAGFRVPYSGQQFVSILSTALFATIGILCLLLAGGVYLFLRSRRKRPAPEGEEDAEAQPA